jgi:thimet oligopeptidase
MKLRLFPLAISLVLLSCAGLKPPAQETMSPAAQEYETSWQTDLERAETLFGQLEGLEGSRTVESVLEPLNDIWLILNAQEGMADLLSNAHPDPDLRASAEQAMQAFSKLSTELSLSRPIYDAVAAVDISNTDQETRRLVELTLQDFRLSGVDKDPETRARIREIQDEIIKIGQDFERNIREDVRSLHLASVEDLAGLPQDYIDAHPPDDDGKITITTDYPDYFPFMTYAHSDAHRKELSRLFSLRAYPQNMAVLDNMVKKRHELANLLGFDTYADLATVDKMIRNPEAAQTFIDRVTAVADPAMNKDVALILNRLQEINPEATAVGAWQRSYLQNLVQQEQFDYDTQESRQYFAYDKVREGLLIITGRLFGVSYKLIQPEVWHPSVESYEVWSGEELIGRIYLDMHPREGKFKHAGMFAITPGVPGTTLPEGGLLCNFPGGDDTPGLMQHSQVSTFFHEFGHLMDYVLGGNQQWIPLSGMAVEWDFVEVASNLLQEWIWDTEILQSFATNSAGEPIPAELVAKMRAARNFGLALWSRGQMGYASISLNLYNRDPQGLDTDDLVRGIMDKYYPLTLLDDTHMQCNFGHLYGYSATYYTYMWSQVIASDLFSEFEKGGIMNQEISMRLRDTILAAGGTKPAEELVRDFLGRDYSFDAFAKWLSGG